MEKKYSTADLLVSTIVGTALYNHNISTIQGIPQMNGNTGVNIGESKTRIDTIEDTSTKSTTHIGDDGSINTRTVTNTTTKTKSRGVSYGIGF